MQEVACGLGKTFSTQAMLSIVHKTTLELLRRLVILSKRTFYYLPNFKGHTITPCGRGLPKLETVFRRFEVMGTSAAPMCAITIR